MKIPAFVIRISNGSPDYTLRAQIAHYTSTDLTHSMNYDDLGNSLLHSLRLGQWATLHSTVLEVCGIRLIVSWFSFSNGKQA